MSMISMLRNKKRPRDDPAAANSSSTATALGSSYSSSTSSSSLLPRTLYHFPSSAPFPVVMDETTFPSESYRSRTSDIKTAIHWGQRKLMLSEIQLLSLYAKENVSYHIVYAGSAPGSHLGFLDDMFHKQKHTWELVDPGQFDRAVLGPRPNFLLRNEFFTNATAYGICANRLCKTPALKAVYEHITDPSVTSLPENLAKLHEQLSDMVGHLDVARGTTEIPSMYEPPLVLPKGLETLLVVAMERKPLLFVSDIRSGSVSLPNFEEHVAENMAAQQCWTEILQPDFAMLKFRLPYTFKKGETTGHTNTTSSSSSSLIDSDGCVPYLRGDMVLPIWTRPTSTEGRLVVPRGAWRRRYPVQHVEDQFFFFNSKVRELMHFNHLLAPNAKLDGHYDSAAEVFCLAAYHLLVDPTLREDPQKPFTVAAVHQAVFGGIGVEQPPSFGLPRWRQRLAESIQATSKKISQHLSIDFEDAIRRRDALVLVQARRGIVLDHMVAEDEDEEKSVLAAAAAQGKDQQTESGRPVSWERAAKQMIEQADADRLRVVWWSNVKEETEEHNSSKNENKKKLWVAYELPL